MMTMLLLMTFFGLMALRSQQQQLQALQQPQLQPQQQPASQPTYPPPTSTPSMGGSGY